MSWIDTSDRIDHDQFQRATVWALVDRIEYLTGVEAHELPELKDKLKRYQDGYMTPAQFTLLLKRLIDKLGDKP